MVRSLTVFLLFTLSSLSANPYGKLIDQILVIEIDARVISANGEHLWGMEHQTLTISGRPVQIALEGANVAINSRLTPYVYPDNDVLLVAQGEVLVTENSGYQSRYSDMDSVRVRLGEKALFFPLGITPEKDSREFTLSIAIKVNYYTEHQERDQHTDEKSTDR